MQPAGALLFILINSRLSNEVIPEDRAGGCLLGVSLTLGGHSQGGMTWSVCAQRLPGAWWAGCITWLWDGPLGEWSTDGPLWQPQACSGP